MVLKRTARDIMTTTVVTASEDMCLTDAIRLLLRWHISGLPVVDDEGNLVGIITEQDVVNFTLSGDAARTRVSEVMIREVVTYDPDLLVADVINRFASHRIRRVPVVEEGKVVGIISRRDVIREMDRIYGRLVVSKEDAEKDYEL
jgi:CBS domain-containing protein